MSTTEIRETLSAVRDAVAPPPPDHLAVRARARAERRRRASFRSAVALSGAAAAAVAAVGVVGLVRDAPPRATAPAAGPVAEPAAVTGFVLDGRLVVGGSGGYERTQHPARTVLGVLDGTLAFLDPRGGLFGVPVTDRGAVGEVRRLLPGVVDRSWYDAGTGTLTVQERGGSVRTWAGGAAAWVPWDRQSDADLYLVRDTTWVESDADGLTLRGPGLTRRLGAGGGVLDGDLAGTALALATTEGLRFLDTRTGRRTGRQPGEWAGRLTPDGLRYVGVTDGGVYLLDPVSGEREPMSGPDHLDGLTWTSEDTAVGRERRPDGSAVLWECRVDRRGCQELYTDPDGSLALTK
ncbi:hypothetical protein [Nocardioides dongkuii]|uniref:hypothetical protein n=1 Tax=Nocardioides dongkuii TaxID=2760089 RepID=UPI0015FCA735|nr:hypothetical protein [Nocardioides dongkuii]